MHKGERPNLRGKPCPSLLLGLSDCLICPHQRVSPSAMGFRSYELPESINCFINRQAVGKPFETSAPQSTFSSLA